MSIRKFLKSYKKNSDITVDIRDYISINSNEINLPIELKGENIDELFDCSAKIIFGYLWDEIVTCLYELSYECESPIEKIFLWALIILALDSGIYVECHTKSYFISLGLPVRDPHLKIFLQKGIGNYRVDFFLEYSELVPDFENRLKKIDPKTGEKLEIPGTKDESIYLIVECDGHDYHERTKEQAKRDREKDRVLQSIGYPIFRFTGSEIYNDVFSCCKQCLKYLSERAWS